METIRSWFVAVSTLPQWLYGFCHCYKSSVNLYKLVVIFNFIVYFLKIYNNILVSKIIVYSLLNSGAHVHVNLETCILFECGMLSGSDLWLFSQRCSCLVINTFLSAQCTKLGQYTIVSLWNSYTCSTFPLNR